MTTLVDVSAISPLQELVAEEIRALMARKRVKQVDIARVLNVSQSQVSQRLNCNIDISVDELGLLADYFGVSPAALLGYAAGSPTGPGGGGGNVSDIRSTGVTAKYPAEWLDKDVA
jgi:hypothetical protein